jgi:membrane fusion protein (multidrug efflux system)
MRTRDESPKATHPRPLPIAKGFAYLLVAAALAIALAACGKEEKAGKEGEGKPGAKEGAEIRVVVSPVEAKPFEDWGAYSADLRGVKDAVLTAGLGGRVGKVEEVGRMVKQGQALCDIESARYGAMLSQARSALELAKGEMDRNKVNVEKGFVGKAVLDKSEFDFQQARVGVLQAQRAYEDSRCQAPFNGILASRMIEDFQTVPPGAPTVRVASIDRLEAVVSIPESEARDFREGQTAEFSLPQDGGKPVMGKLKSIDRAVEARNRTVTARIEIANAGNALRPGMVGRARILRRKYDQAVVIPSQAVLRLQEGTKVMLARAGKAVEAAVRLGPAAGDNVIIESGVAAGDTLITTGAFQVSNGTKISY